MVSLTELEIWFVSKIKIYQKQLSIFPMFDFVISEFILVYGLTVLTKKKKNIIFELFCSHGKI